MSITDATLKNLFYLSIFTVLMFTAATSAGYSNYASASTLTNEIVEPSNNLFSLESHYVIGFTTATTGTIQIITITFPAGFNIASAKLIFASGIGSGAISAAGQTLTYTVNSPVSVPPGINIMLDLGKIVNNAVVSNTVSITTRDNSINNVIIDGPTTSAVFTLKTVSSSMLGSNTIINSKIANGAVSNTKIANNSVNSTQIIDGSITNTDLSNAAAIALSKLAAGVLPSGIAVNSANIAPGVALSGSASIDSPTFSIDSSNHRVGVGTTTPASKLDVLGDIKGSNNISWSGGKSVLGADQGGSIELGDGLTLGAIPYIDFHYGKGVSQAFNMRLINNADGLLSIYGGKLNVNDSVYVGAKSNPSPGANSLYIKNDMGDGFDTFRLDASGNNLYLIAKSDPGAATGAGIVFRTAQAGGGELDRMSIDPAGNLNFNAGGKLVCAGCVSTTDLIDGTITGEKVSSSFMKQVILTDDTAGNNLGWNPDGVTTVFFIQDPSVSQTSSSVVVNITDAGSGVACADDFNANGGFYIVCTGPPGDGSALTYLVITMPTTILTHDKIMPPISPEILNKVHH